MKEWTQGFPQNNALVQAEQFNDEYDTHKGTFNGGLDRTALNDDWCNRTHLKSNALLLADTTNLTAIRKFTEQGTASTPYFGCVQFNTYQGGWALTNISQTLNNCHEGFLHVELKGSLYINQYEAERSSANRLKIRINLNGIRIVGAGYFVQPFISFRICGDVPVNKGTNVITVSWRFTGANTDYNDTDPLMHMFGVQLFSVVRWR